MDHDELISLRPAGDSVEAVKASLAEIERRKQEAEHLRAAKIAEEPKLLLTANGKEIAAFNAKIGELDITIRQLTALLAAVQPELPAAEHRAKLASARAAGEEAASLNEQVGKFFLGEYRSLAAKIIAGLELEKRAMIAELRYRNMIAHLQLGPDDVALLPVVSRPYDLRMGEQRLAYSVNMPAALPLDKSDETPVKFYRAMHHQHGVVGTGGTVSAADADRERNPRPLEPSRRLTDAELAAAGVVQRGISVRQPGTPAHGVRTGAPLGDAA